MTHRDTPISAKLVFSSDEEAIDHIKAKLRYPAANVAVRAGIIIAMIGLGICWMSPNMGQDLLVPSWLGQEGQTIPVSLAFGAAVALFGGFIVLFGRWLRHRRKIELLQQLRGTPRYIGFVSRVMARRL